MPSILSKLRKSIPALFILSLFSSCNQEKAELQEQKSVTIYTSLDRPHSEPILKKFEEKTGIEVKAVYDTEASKTVGLINRLYAEKENPKADVFWNSEVLRTVQLKSQGITTPYHSPSAESIPAKFKDSEGYWTGFAARARVILYNTNLVSTPPTTFTEIALPEWTDKVALANPLFGTTNTHLASQWASQGKSETTLYFETLKKNGVKIVPGNGPARDLVASGEIPLCITDTDDAWGAISKGRPVKMIYPDQEKGGTLLIPNTVCLLKNSPNPETGKLLIDFLLSEEVESLLAHSPSAQIPLRSSVAAPQHVQQLKEIKSWDVDFEQTLKVLEDATRWAMDELVY